MFLRFLIAIGLVLLNTSGILFAQNNFCSTLGATVQLTVIGGGNVNFIFNTIEKYKNGIPFSPSAPRTVIGIAISDPFPLPLPNYSSWAITFEAEDADGDGAITGVDPANTIPFAAIELQAAATGPGCVGCVFAAGPIPLPGPLDDGAAGCPPVGLTQTGTILVFRDPLLLPPPPPLETRTNADSQIEITYQCGVAISLLGYAADYYSEIIYFTLSAYP